MSVDGQYLANGWNAASSCAQEPMQQWSGCGAMSPEQMPEWPSPPSMQNYPVSYPQDNMRVPPMYHPGMEQGYPQQQQQHEHNLLWTKAALESQCQNYLRFSTHNLHA